MACFDSCKCIDERGQGSILYSILNRDNHYQAYRCQKIVPRHQLCSCAAKKKVVIRAPQTVFKAVSAVLLKTLIFVKNVPCFRGLPAGDQLQLVSNSWAPLLVLGMAQDFVDFETVETQEPSLLQRILTYCQDKQQPTNETYDHGVSVTDVQGIKMFLIKCRGLNISIREYAFLKGAILFNPDITELECRDYIGALQREAYHALNEHVKMIYRGDATRFAKLHVALSKLRSINANVVAGLFLRPAIGKSSVDELILTMFYEKWTQ